MPLAPRRPSLQAFAKMTMPYLNVMEGSGNTINYSGLSKLQGTPLSADPNATARLIDTNFAVVVLPPGLIGTWQIGARGVGRGV